MLDWYAIKQIPILREQPRIAGLYLRKVLWRCRNGTKERMKLGQVTVNGLIHTVLGTYFVGMKEDLRFHAVHLQPTGGPLSRLAQVTRAG